jgi:hypothetical protein
MTSRSKWLPLNSIVIIHPTEAVGRSYTGQQPAENLRQNQIQTVEKFLGQQNSTKMNAEHMLNACAAFAAVQQFRYQATGM